MGEGEGRREAREGENVTENERWGGGGEVRNATQ